MKSFALATISIAALAFLAGPSPEAFAGESYAKAACETNTGDKFELVADDGKAQIRYAGREWTPVITSLKGDTVVIRQIGVAANMGLAFSIKTGRGRMSIAADDGTTYDAIVLCKNRLIAK